MDARRRDERRMRWIEDRVGQASLSGPFLWGGEMLTASKRRQLAAIPLGLLCALALGLPACAETPKSDDDARYEVDLRGAPLKGASDPKVVLVEFIDIECPYCAVTARNAQTLLGRCWNTAGSLCRAPVRRRHPTAISVPCIPGKVPG